MSEKIRMIVGVDEVGRGALAGPVTAAAVLLGLGVINGLDDSKKLSFKQRAEMYPIIIEECLTYGVAHATPEEIERINILQATYIAMQRAVAEIVVVPDEVLVDGNSLPDLPYPSTAIIGGDGKVPEIMAASVLAKVTRDRFMIELDKSYPQYGFASNKGYPTPEHLAALREHGSTPHHRATFAPVRDLLKS